MTKQQILIAGALGLVVVLVASGCGGGKKSTAKETSTTACIAPATTQPTNLPSTFPIPDQLIVTEVHKNGSTNVVDGYYTAGLEQTFEELQDYVEQVGYTIRFQAPEIPPSVIPYEGSGRIGKIMLRANCLESVTTRVHITSRPV